MRTGNKSCTDSFSYGHCLMTDDEEALLAASREAYKAKAKRGQSEKHGEEAFLDGADIIHFDDDEYDTHRHDLKSAKSTKQPSAKKRGKQSQEPVKDVSETALHYLEVSPVTTSRKPTKREIEEVCMYRLFPVPRQVGRTVMVWNACFRWCILQKLVKEGANRRRKVELHWGRCSRGYGKGATTTDPSHSTQECPRPQTFLPWKCRHWCGARHASLCPAGTHCGRRSGTFVGPHAQSTLRLSGG